jgi:hypothetical protein
MIKLDLKPSLRILGQFTVVAAIALPLLAAILTKGEARWFAPWNWQWTHPAVLWLAGIGFGQFALFRFGWRLPTQALYVVLTLVAFPIGLVVSHVLMAVIYYLVITPIGLVFRLVGRDVLGRRLDKQKPSYWHVRTTPRDPASYFKLY